MDTPTPAQQSGRSLWPLYALSLGVLIVALAAVYQYVQLDQLQADVAALKAVPDAAVAESAPAPLPDPVPARPGAPRAAVRPTQPNTSAAAPGGWGTTDLDREIEDFTRAINQPEQNQ